MNNNAFIQSHGSSRLTRTFLYRLYCLLACLKFGNIRFHLRCGSNLNI